MRWVDRQLRREALTITVDPGNVDHIFTQGDVVLRIKNQSTVHYTGIYNVMKGVTLTAVGLSIVFILVNHLPDQRLALIPAAFLAVVITYNGATVGQTIVHLHPSAIDVLFPMSLTLAELVVVSLPGFDESGAPIPGAWFLALGVWQILAGVVIASIISRLVPSLYEEQLRPVVERYRDRMVFDWWCATSGGLLALAYWLFSRVAAPGWDAWGVVDLALVVMFTVFFVGAIRHHGATRRELMEGLLRTQSRAKAMHAA